MQNKYIIIDQISKDTFHFFNEIDMGFTLDFILDKYDRIEIPYRIVYYNNCNIIAIRNC